MWRTLEVITAHRTHRPRAYFLDFDPQKKWWLFFLEICQKKFFNNLQNFLGYVFLIFMFFYFLISVKKNCLFFCICQKMTDLKKTKCRVRRLSKIFFQSSEKKAGKKIFLIFNKKQKTKKYNECFYFFDYLSKSCLFFLHLSKK